MRRLLCLVVTLMMVMPGIALAQSPDRPVAELGAQGSKGINDRGVPVAWALRLTVPLKRRTAIEVTADIQQSYQSVQESARVSAREFNVHWRQTVFTAGRWQASSICVSCDIDEGAWILPGAVAGGIVGGLLGMMVDGLNPGRQKLFRGSTTVVTPVITPTGKAIDVAIRWR